MIALVVGHKASSKGACNVNGICEYDWNQPVVEEISRLTGQNTKIFYRDSYNQLPHEINAHNPDYILSFHCNAFNTTATGSETLYYHSSEKGKALAMRVQEVLQKTLNLVDRGIKPKHSEDRGGYLLSNTVAPCVIVESFFIDNPNDLTIANENVKEFVDNFVNFIDDKIG